jgi:tRNA(Ile)-lysidine synthase
VPAAEAPRPGVAADGPLADDEIDRIFAPLADAPLIALAVSGGADSLALLVAVDRWRRRGGKKPSVVVLTVDHRLRKGSHNEALAVQRIARARGIKAGVLTRQGTRPSSDIEAAARGARYRLLVDACREARATHLVVAHHRDDLAETFLLRLKRGAGVFGLAAMRPSLPLGDVTLVRPFLRVPRARLTATTAAAKLTPVDDPMNADPRFDRARMRGLLPMLAAEGIDPAQLADTAMRLAEAAEAIDVAATALLAEAVEADAIAVGWLTVAPFAAAARAVLLRALWRLLVAVGGDDYPPRHDRLASLADALLAHGGRGRFKRTLAGVVIEWRGGRFGFYREGGREGLPTLPMRPGATFIWDHRFEVTAGKTTPAGVTIGPLGEEDRREIGAAAGTHAAGALAAIPVLRRKGRIVAAPLLSREEPSIPVTVRSILGERLRQPPLFPDLAASR